MTNRRRLLFSMAGAAALAACNAVPQRPVRAIQYDFGPLPPVPGAGEHERLAPIVLGEVEATSALDTSSLLYRLAYADANELQPYSRARWSAPIPQLVQQRLRERLGRDRVVLDLTDTATLARTGGAMPRILRVRLEEFAQSFETPARSAGVVRLRATLSDNTPAGEKIVGQHLFAEQRPAPTADAPGGVRALAAATDAAADELAHWLQQVA
jgi:cholesterol transport system auxiliary component